MFGNECLGDLNYEATTAAIVMAGLMISFLIDYVAHRFASNRERKIMTSSDISPLRSAEDEVGKRQNPLPETHDGIQPVQKSATLDVLILEAGIIFHSLLLGLTSVVAGDSHYITLFIVVLFHQFFEGVALGTRIGELPSPTPSSLEDPRPSPAPASKPVTLRTKLLLGLPYALVTSTGMAIGIGVLGSFNGNDPATIVAIGTLDALSAGILIWVGVVEMLAKDWLHDGELARASLAKVWLGGGALVAGLVVMSLLGKWI